MKSEVDGVLNQFRAIRGFAVSLRAISSVEQIRGLIEEYADAKSAFDRIRAEMDLKAELRSIFEYDLNTRKEAILQSIEIQCEKAIGILESIVVPLPKEDLDKVSRLRQELGEMSAMLSDIYFEKNVNEAIDEYEHGHFLASALISGRVLIYALDQISGKSIVEKIETLREKGIIKKEKRELEEVVIKADKKARNFLSHDIRVEPSASDALSLLGDSVRILKLTVDGK